MSRETTISTTSNHDVLCLLLLVWMFLAPILYPSHAVFLSIDCGSDASSYTESSITWTGDDGYVQNGKPKVVSDLILFLPAKVSLTVMSTLRAFPTLKKNCYTINVDKGDKVLARASFYYGNYDLLDSPPTFELQFDGNFWATVNTSSSSDRNIYYEAIYITKANTTSICLLQTLPGQIPFISVLELRSLESTMYSLVDPHHALFTAFRSNSGTNITIRYPDDDYDRIWEAETSIAYTENVESEAVSIDVSEAKDKPPQAVLQKAAVGDFWGFLRTIIYLRTEYLPSLNVPVYITAYFSEVAHLNATDKRSIDVYINNDPYSTKNVPPFGSVSVVQIANRTANSNTNITIRGSDDSTLPPLLNAYEVYSVGDALTDGTNGDDVNGLVALQKQFDKLQIWSGDPCLPSKFSWEWLDCNTEPSPRVTTLNLSSFDLSGTLPDFSDMIALEIIDFHNNYLYGPIPDFLGSLPNLKFLNLADNSFNGTIPSSLSDNKNLKLIVTGNCLAGMSCKPKASPLPSNESPNMPENQSSAGLDPNPPPQDQTELNFPSSGMETQKQALTLIVIFPVSLLFLLQMNF